MYYFGDITLDNALMVFNVNYLRYLVRIFKDLFLKDSLEKVLNYVGEWHDQPGDIFNVLRSFLIALYGRKCIKVEFQEDIIFSSIPKADMENIYSGMYTLAKEYNVEMEAIFDALFTEFNRSKVFSRIELYSFLISLYNFIHMHKCKVKTQKRASLKNKPQIKNSIRKEGREFIRGYKKEELKKDLDGACIRVGEKIYPHNLLSLGFSFKQKTEINIIWV